MINQQGSYGKDYIEALEKNCKPRKRVDRHAKWVKKLTLESSEKVLREI